MPATLEDILSALCSQVSLLSENESQRVFMLGDNKEAKLAGEILLAHGFDAKAYPEANQTKFYVTKPADDAAVQSKLAAALAYARAFRPIKQSLDTLAAEKDANLSDYQMALVNAGANRQFSIQLISTGNAAKAAPSVSKPVPVAAAQAPRPVAAKAAHRPAAKSDEFIAGPEIGKKYPKSANQTEQAHERGFRNKLSKMFIKNIAANGLEILMALAGVLGIISLLIMSKTFLCPDLAVAQSKQNHAWYCKKAGDDDGKNNNN